MPHDSQGRSQDVQSGWFADDGDAITVLQGCAPLGNDRPAATSDQGNQDVFRQVELLQ